uniref:Uncharacterized protein n=1 Tax=Glossina palpalis gambiensis TaxID=67801 RepID=A0A1B0BBH7_9MUSC
MNELGLKSIYVRIYNRELTPKRSVEYYRRSFAIRIFAKLVQVVDAKLDMTWLMSTRSSSAITSPAPSSFPLTSCISRPPGNLALKYKRHCCRFKTTTFIMILTGQYALLLDIYLYYLRTQQFFGYGWLLLVLLTTPPNAVGGGRTFDVMYSSFNSYVIERAWIPAV